uniref:NSFL1 cofactor p47-like n=1 Tax=Styela clava TaxID=7725 RepID=UPI0019393822|nr:NSFL1 cofactor p47-like [Styela clava]
MADHDSLIEQFKAVTNENDDRSRFYLESANWEIDLALSSFYDNAGGPELMETEPVIPQPGASLSNTEQNDEFHDAMVDSSDGKDTKSKPSGTSSNSRFRSLADYDRAEDRKSDDSEEEGQEYYAGGSEHSGEVIVGPGKKKRGEDIVSKMFKNAKKHGAMPVDEASSSSGKKKDKKYFTGGGYKLGAEAEDHEFIPGAEKPEERKLDVVLKLWKNGFTVGDGPLRDYHDPETKEFLGAIGKGEIPQELLRMAQGGEVNLDMEDHKNEDYKPEKQKMKAFTGEGHTLGGITPNVVSSVTPPSKPAETTSVDPEVIINESSPVTTIRVQLGDGSRVTQKFNHSHQVADVYSFVRNRSSESRNFVLMTTFPNKELKDDETTLKEGKLLNAVIVQRFK